MAIVYKTRNRKRARSHGFLARKSSTNGRNVITRRRRKGRKKIIKV